MWYFVKLIAAWMTDTKFHVKAASTAAGTSIGMITVLGILETKIDKAKSDIEMKLERSSFDIKVIKHTADERKILVDERFLDLHEDMKYMRGAIDATNQNVLQLSRDLKQRR